MAYTHGSDHARNVAFALAASLQSPVAPDLETQIAKAAKATFPVTAKDLMPALEGAKLGQQLKALKERWIASNFTLSREELLSE